MADKFKFRAENLCALDAGGRPAEGKAILLGITKASLSTDSFISAAFRRPRSLPHGHLPPWTDGSTKPTVVHFTSQPALA